MPAAAREQPVSLLLTFTEVCALLGRSASSLRRDLDTGRLPAPSGGMRKRGRGRGPALYWERRELMAWVAAGRPDRRAWEKIRARHVK